MGSRNSQLGFGQLGLPLVRGAQMLVVLWVVGGGGGPATDPNQVIRT